MKDEIKPRLVDGEPMCSGAECPRWANCLGRLFEAKDLSTVEKLVCSSGLRQQRDEARRELCETETDGAIDADDIIRSRAAARGWSYLYEEKK